MKKTLVACCSAAVLALIITILSTFQIASTGIIPEKSDVVIPMSVSRPGCETTNSCYAPPEITVNAGKTITWINKDRAFHTVTSGYYNKFDGMFDSGHIDPGQTFSFKFDKLGGFHYFCNLHPWMEGTVIVT